MNNRLLEQTYYEILEVSQSATQQEIHEAYYRARETYSTNSPALYSMFSEDEARELLSLIEEAFTVLSNQTRRSSYDNQINRKLDSTISSVGFNERNSSPNVSELPDFKVPNNVEAESQKHSDKKVGTQQSSLNIVTQNHVNQLPDGFAKTKFSVYEVDQDFERLISQNTYFDGPFLQRVRIYKQVKLEEMSDESRVSRSYLSAVEQNDYSSLPAPVFIRGFVVQMARLLGLDEKKVADSYMNILKENKK